MSRAPATAPTWSNITFVNHEKAWDVLRRLERDQLLVLFARTLRFVPATCLEQIFQEHAHPHEVGDVHQVERRPLVEAVRAFVEAALRGDYYLAFPFNSPHYTDKSGGTQTFEAQLDLLFDRCVDEATSAESAQVVTAYELLFDLLREIDKFEKDIVFFADEGGVWQFNLNWKRILPPFIQCLAKVTERGEFERRTEAVLEEFVDSRQRGELRRAFAGEQHARATEARIPTA
jgi:hypothetical protein